MGSQVCKLNTYLIYQGWYKTKLPQWWNLLYVVLRLWDVERNFSCCISVSGNVKHKLLLGFCIFRRNIIELGLVVQMYSIRNMLMPTYIFIM